MTERIHPHLIRIHERDLHSAVELPFLAYAKALVGAVKRGILTKQEALEIIEDANLHVLEGTAAIGKVKH
jgi:hypothetical protein